MAYINTIPHNTLVLALLDNKQVSIKQCAYSAITRIELLSYPSIMLADKQVIEPLIKQLPRLQNIINSELLTLDKKLAAKL